MLFALTQQAFLLPVGHERRNVFIPFPDLTCQFLPVFFGKIMEVHDIDLVFTLFITQNQSVVGAGPHAGTSGIGVGVTVFLYFEIGYSLFTASSHKTDRID
jgi:hypothetical protein